MADIDRLDLDAISPVKGEVVIQGKIYQVHPPKLKSIIDITRLGKKFRSGKATEEEAIDAFDKFLEILYSLSPDLKKDNVDFSFDEIHELIDFVTKLAKPADTKALEAAGVSPAEKKTTQPDSPEQSPTSSEDTQATP